MGIWKRLFGNTQPLPQPEPNPAFVELVAVYKTQISELRVEAVELKRVIAERDAQIIELRKHIEIIPRMTVKPEKPDVYLFDADSINDQPSFDAAADHLAAMLHDNPSLDYEETRKKVYETHPEWAEEHRA